MGSAHFRANVVAMVTDSAGRLMAFERSDNRDSWQLPQGGIDDDETPIEAAWRELGEETGLTSDDVELIDEFPDWTAYEWPSDFAKKRKGRLGQCQRWFTFRVRDDSTEPTPDDVEFVAWRWVEPIWLVENVVEFRRSSYARVLLGQ